MIRAIQNLACATVLVVAMIGHVQADVITFGTTSVDRLDLAGAQVEGAFTYVAFGDSWELITAFGNPPAALVTGFNGEPPQNGFVVEFARTDGGLFTFGSVDFATILNSNSDDILFSGFFNGILTDTLLLDFSTQSFQTVPSGFDGAIDLLTIEIFKYWV